MDVGFADHPLFLKHEMAPGHPERPERIRAVSVAAGDAERSGSVVRLVTRDATRGELELVHVPSYLDQLAQTATRDFTVLDVDTSANRFSYPASLRAAGSAVAAVEAAASGSIRRSFVATRPPGHHAEAGHAMGFCLINNAAVAAAAALAGGMDRVAVVDWDVHHGNGTAHIFEHRSDVLYISVHQHPHYPGTGSVRESGTGAGSGFTVNIPLPAGCTDGDYLAAMEMIVEPVLSQYGPQLIIVSAGFDAHARDPLAGMRLTAAGYAALTRVLVGVAEGFCGGRIVHLLEGGYDLEGLRSGVSAVLMTLAGVGDGPLPTAAAAGTSADAFGPTEGGSRAIRAARASLSRFWSLAEDG